MNSESALLDLAARKRILFVGETIIDVYHYVRPLGRPTKDAIVSVELVSTQSFTGGVVAAKAHAQDLCESVGVYSGGPVIRKERYVEESHVRKLFEAYIVPQPLTRDAFPSLNPYDAVVVTDYGHGMIDAAMIERLSSARFLAVNVQTNSGNYGFNLATKYSACDYLVVDEPEARLATQNRTGPIQESIAALGRIAPKVVVTLGKRGAIGLSGDAIYECAAFTDKIVDTMGAGDAFFAVTAPIAEEANMPSLLRIGNAAGAIKASIVGHERAVTKNALLDLLARG